PGEVSGFFHRSGPQRVPLIVIPVEIPTAVVLVLVDAIDGAVRRVDIPVLPSPAVVCRGGFGAGGVVGFVGFVCFLFLPPPLAGQAVGAGGHQHAGGGLAAPQRGRTAAPHQHLDLLGRSPAADGQRRLAGGGGGGWSIARHEPRHARRLLAPGI